MASVARAIRIGPADHGRTMTLDEFVGAEVEQGYRYELGRGVLEVSDVPYERHWQVVSNLYKGIARYDLARPGVILRFGGGSECQVLMPRFQSGRHPDRSVVLRSAPKDWRGRTLPFLAAEVVSEGSIKRDYETNREEYLAYGLLEYWIVDPVKRLVNVLTRHGDLWHEAFYRDEQTSASTVLPGFATTVAELWLDVDNPQDGTSDSAANGS
jgi:Uma2 family endonuclease